ncbi:MAG TPA: cyanophycin synthetase [Flavobacterium sp.]|jgi:cyanophycin synthetase
MKILKTQVLRGPNVWSNYRQHLIQIRLDLEEMEKFPTDKLPGFKERLQEMLPGLVRHECSEGVRGGFLIRLERGTWLGHVMEHVALEIQTMAGMETGYGRTRGTSEKGVYNVVFAYSVEECGLFAGQAAFRIVDALSKGEPFDVSPEIEELKRLYRKHEFGPSTKSIVDEAKKRGIPFKRTGDNSIVQLGYGANQKKFQATITGNTSSMATDAASDKEHTKKLLASAKIPVAKGGLCYSEAEFKQLVSKTGYPLVTKPLNANQGKGITININSWEQALEGFQSAKLFSKHVLVEKYVEGFDFRLLVIDGKFVAAAKRIPAHVKGDGKSTISELIDNENQDPRRGAGHENVLTKLSVNRDSEQLLEKNGFTLDHVPFEGDIVYLRSTANLSTGGTAVDVTDEVHPENIFMAQRIAKVIGLDVCGIDIMAQNLSEPIKKIGGVVLEVNAAPGFRMHLAPSEGTPRNVAAAVVDYLYPPGKPSRIPIIGVTGTNGKTTTTRLLAHMAKTSGFVTGYTTTDGIYIDDYLIEEGDTTGPLSAGVILGDPTVEFAVLETARGGLLRSGLMYDKCDVGIITNIKEDHLGLNDINTLEDLANVKAVVARSVKKDGWAILNADDANCVKIGGELVCNVAYFSMDENNPLIQEQLASGKPVAVFENGYASIIKGNEKIRIEDVKNIPLACNGQCKFMVANALAAALAAYSWGFSIEDIRTSIREFTPSFEQTPGRLNLFEFEKFKVLVDYAHNPHGYAAVEDYISNMEATRKIGIISGIGDRRDEDIRECARIACRMFDHIIIRQEHSLRDRSEDKINELLLEGIRQSGREDITYEIVPQENEAIKKALAIAREGDFIVALSDVYKGVVATIQEALAKEKEELKSRTSARKAMPKMAASGGMHYSHHGKQVEE